MSKEQIYSFDVLYKKRRVVEKMKLSEKNSYVTSRLIQQDIRKIMEEKIKTKEDLEFFVRNRGNNMQVPELSFCIEFCEKMQLQPPAQLDEILIATTKVPKKYAKTLLKYAIRRKIVDYEILTKITKSYLEEYVNLDILLGLPTNILKTFQKTIIRESKNVLSSAIAVFCRLVYTVEEIRQFDEYFMRQVNFMSQPQKIQVLYKFSQTNQKGIFVQYLKYTLKQEEYLKYILQTLIFLTELQYVDEHYFQFFEIKILEKMQTKQYLNLVIQIAHHNCAGSQFFWQAVDKYAVKNDYSQLFAILGGLERNFTTDVEIFQILLSLDPEMQAIDLYENEFLKLMLVYWANMKAIDKNSEFRPIIYKKVKDKLLDIYKRKKFKIFTMLFLWLLEEYPVRKKEYRKLLYASYAYEELLKVMYEGVADKRAKIDEYKVILSSAEDILRDKYEYFHINPERSALEEYIRRLKFKFEGTKL